MSGSGEHMVFVLGIMQRSGTDFTRSILGLHQDCQVCNVIHEDYLMEHLDLLIHYAESSYKRWNPKWDIEGHVGPPDFLCRCIGDGLISFLKSQFAESLGETSGAVDCPELFGKTLITKTPSVVNLRHFFRFFPDSHLLILVRDGRSVVESGVRSFDWDYERAMHRWADAARSIIEFRQDPANMNFKHMLIRYEDLNENTEEEARKIFSFLGLDVATYDFSAARTLPVQGSSDSRKNKASKVHWRPMQKSEGFNTVPRWNDWTRNLHERFNRIAGDYLEQLGYKKQIYHGQAVRWFFVNILLDVKYKAKMFWRRFWLRRMVWAVIRKLQAVK